ncbi:MAG TPA: TIGR01777 family protein [Sulfurimonas sp.]|nr:TIGR01777 family protein [Sulfurimonas sp.]
MNILICGSSGFVGNELRTYFQAKGNNVLGLRVREGTTIENISKQVEGVDILINLAGVSIFSRWTQSYKKSLYNSRIDTTKKLVKAISLCHNKPRMFISTSAVGIYKNEEYSDENSGYGTSYLSKICKDWEDEAFKTNIPTTIFRFGVVLGKNGGMLQKMWLPFFLGLGGIIGSGKQSLSWIHIYDLCKAYEHIIENDLEGVYNLCSPLPTSNQELTKTLAGLMKRPSVFPVPAFMIRLIFSEGASFILEGQRVRPKHLLAKGFKFKYTSIQDALKSFI